LSHATQETRKKLDSYARLKKSVALSHGQIWGLHGHVLIDSKDANANNEARTDAGDPRDKKSLRRRTIAGR
jgi:hypothetical protein